MKNKLKLLFVILLTFCFISSAKASNTDDYNYETELAKFPASYQEKIKTLHNIYKNSVFVPVIPTYKNTKLNWDVMLAS